MGGGFSTHFAIFSPSSLRAILRYEATREVSAGVCWYGAECGHACVWDCIPWDKFPGSVIKVQNIYFR